MSENENGGAALVVREKNQSAVSLSDVFGSVASFEFAQRIGKMLSTSSMVPDTYKGDGNIGNCVIALEMANRIGMNVVSVMQNLYIVHGRPAWSSQFLISCINASGKFSPLRYMMQGEEGKDSWGCRAWATDRSGEKLVGPLVTIEMARLEGWYGKNGSKWKTMPELMLRYRAATLFARLYSPELTMGIMTGDEVQDIVEAPSARVVDAVAVGDQAPSEKPKSKLAAKLAKTAKHDPVVDVPDADIVPVADKPAEPDPERGDLVSRILPFVDSFGVSFKRFCGQLEIGVDQWKTAPVDALRTLLSKLEEQANK